MSQIFDEKGKVVPVTLIRAGPCFITQIKTKEEDGYRAIQLGFEKKQKNIKKTEKNKEFKCLREFRLQDRESIQNHQKIKTGTEINVSIFKKGDKVKISGLSKGKGFAGGVKRWGFKDRAKAHGTKDMRKIGSTGSRFPQRVIKGRKMPGRMGGKRMAIKNLEVAGVERENNLLMVKGAVPGHRNTILEIQTS